MTLTRDSYIASPIPIEGYLRQLFPKLDASTVFDVGSCEGEDAIRYARLFPYATVYAFEPLPNNIRLLRANLDRWSIRNVRVIDRALSDIKGRATFYVSSGQPDGVEPSDWDYGNKSSSLLRPQRHLDVHPWVHFDQQIDVETDTVENFCRDESIQRVDFVHLDVQGAELKVLEGAGPLLERVGAVWMEVEAVALYEGQPLKPDVERFMIAHGFRLVSSTVDSVAGDQLYFNPRLLNSTLSAPSVLTPPRASTRRAGSPIIRRLARRPRAALQRSAQSLSSGIRTGLVSRMSGRHRFQRMFQDLHEMALAGMNMGSSADHPATSGEDGVLARLPLSPVVFDVGASVGDYAALVLAVRPAARVWCFEPSAAARTELLGRMGSQVTSLAIGLGDAEADVDLFAPARGSPLSSVYPREHPVIEFGRTERVHLRRLDDVVRELAVDHIDLLKLDVEGHELAVLRGAEETIRSGAIAVIQFEFGGSNIDSRTFLRDFFVLLGPTFDIHRIVSNGLVPVTYHERMEVFTTTNYVAIRRPGVPARNG